MPRTNLPTRPLGTTGYDITRVGFGSWAVGGGNWAFGWGPQDDRASVAAIRHAVESGVNWIDTAAVYGLGHSERVVARALSAYSDAERPYVFTKCGNWFDPTRPAERPVRRADKEALRRGVENSLRRLRVEALDLVQLHWPPADGRPIEEYWQTFAELKREGKVRAIGLCNHSVDQLARAEAVAHVDTLQPPFSAIRAETASDLLPWAAAHRTGVIVYSPMGSGLLTGAFSRERVAALDDADWRKHDPAFTRDLERNLRVARAIGEVAAAHGVPQPAAAAAWTLGFPGVSGAIVGARGPQQVDGWLPAATLRLSEADYQKIHLAGAGAVPATAGRA